MEKQLGIGWYREKCEEIRKLNLTSDLLSSVVFEDKLALQDVLRILTGISGLKVVQVEPQRSYRNLYGHGSVADVWAENESKTQFNMEIQIADNEDHLRRSRFIQSRIDSRVLSTGMSYEKLPELYMIFITERDFLKVGTSHVEVVRMTKETNRQMDNGVHEIYINLESPSKNEKEQRLLSYIKNTDEESVSVEGFRYLAERVKYLKNEEGGVKYMCELIEKEWKAGRKIGWEAGIEEGWTAGKEAGWIAGKEAGWTAGKEAGWTAGKEEGKKEFILEFLNEIGTVSSDLSKRVTQETDTDVLGRWVRLAARVRNVSEFETEM